MIDELDLQRTALALSVSANLITASPGTPAAHSDAIMRAAKASSSELMQGVVQTKLNAFFKAAAQSNVVDASATRYLLDQVSLKSQCGAGCLAIVLITNKTH